MCLCEIHYRCSLSEGENGGTGTTGTSRAIGTRGKTGLSDIFSLCLENISLGEFPLKSKFQFYRLLTDVLDCMTLVKGLTV